MSTQDKAPGASAVAGDNGVERWTQLTLLPFVKKNPERLAAIDLAKVELAAPEPPERQLP